jgi:hypothetical protein
MRRPSLFACLVGLTAFATHAIAGGRPLPRGVPANAVAVLAVSVSARQPLRDLGVFLLDAQAKTELVEEARALAKSRLGIDISAVGGAAGFALPDGSLGAIFSGVRAPAGPPAGGDVTFAVVGDALVVGQAAAVKAAVDTLAGRAPGLDATRGLGRLLADELGAPLALAVDGHDASVASLGLEAFGATLAPGGLHLVGRGPDEVLRGMVGKLEAVLAEVEKKVQADRASQRFDVALQAAAQYHVLQTVRRQVRPVVADGRLQLDLKGDQETMLLLGVFAAVAIPAFEKNARRARAAAP